MAVNALIYFKIRVGCWDRDQIDWTGTLNVYDGHYDRISKLRNVLFDLRHIKSE
jgi:hypothetical protein